MYETKTREINYQDINYNHPIKGTDSNCFDHKIMIHRINYIYSNILVAQLCFSEPQLFNIICPFDYEYQP